MKKKILVVVGTRPEAIKLIPVYLHLKDSEKYEMHLCLTGQHKTMVETIMEFFKVQADSYLSVMSSGQTLAGLTSLLISEMTDLLQQQKPELLIVQGDTTSAFASALAAFYLGIRVAHVEAGLRTFDITSPFPEEANRKFVSCIADLHFAPTQRNVENLLSEGINRERIVKTGNTVIDALNIALEQIKSEVGLQRTLIAEVERLGYSLAERPFVLITGHRRESFGKGFEEICEAIHRLADRYGNYDFVYPVHLNPQVKDIVFERLNDLPNIYLLPPLDYGTFVLMMDKCEFVLTDSGGVQEEAPSLRKPVFVMRETTERQEGIETGLVKLVGVASSRIYESVATSINLEFENFNLGIANPYGDGDASLYILDALELFFRPGLKT